MGKLAILHTNDIHSHFEEWYKIKALFQQRKIELQQEGYDVIIVDVGDFSDRVHPLTEASQMLYNMEEMNEVYDYVTFGNNEGIGNRKEQLIALYDAFCGTCVMSHCVDVKTKQRPESFTEIALVTLSDGRTIGIMGGTAPYPKSYLPLGWELKEAIPCFQALYDQYKDTIDDFILLSHFGKYIDHDIAEACPFFKVIIGGHTHHLYEKGKWVNGVLLTSCQKHGHYCGEITYNSETNELQAKTYAMDEYTLSHHDMEKIMDDVERGHQLLQRDIVGKCDSVLSKKALLYGIEHALMQQYQLPVILHTGLLLDHLIQQDVTKDDWHRLLPHPLHLATVTLDGENMNRFLFEIEKNSHFLRHFHLVGMGFRGKEFGEILFTGLQKKDGQWYFQNKPIQKNKEYTFLTLDHYEFVPFFPTIAYAGKTNYIMDGFLRDKVAMLTPSIIQYGKEFNDGKRRSTP